MNKRKERITKRAQRIIIVISLIGVCFCFYLLLAPNPSSSAREFCTHFNEIIEENKENITPIHNFLSVCSLISFSPFNIYFHVNMLKIFI